LFNHVGEPTKFILVVRASAYTTKLSQGPHFLPLTAAASAAVGKTDFRAGSAVHIHVG